MIHQQNWRQLSSIQIGGVICLPVIVIGQALSRNYGFSSAVAAIVLGNAVLLLLATITALMGHSERKTTIENASNYFGKSGSLCFAGVMMISMLGWFGIQLNLMSLALLDMLAVDPHSSIFYAVNICLGLLMTAGVLFGIKGLNLLADISLPFMVATILYALWMPGKVAAEPDHIKIGFGGISMVIASFLAGVIDLPTYFRHAKSRKDALISVVLIYGMAVPAMELAGVYLGTTRGGESVIEMLKGAHPVWNLWICLFIVLAGWTTNNTNLYSAVINLQFMWPGRSSAIRTWAAGIAGVLLACCNLLDHLELILALLGISIGSMGAVVMVGYLIGADNDKSRALTAWGCGFLLGLGSLYGLFTLTTIAVLDAFIGSGAVLLILYLKQRKMYASVYSK